MTPMTGNAMHTPMGRGAFAMTAGAASSCAQTASRNTVSLILDAVVIMIMASIIICVLLCTLLGLVSLLGLVILAVLAGLVYLDLPEKRMRA